MLQQLTVDYCKDRAADSLFVCEVIHFRIDVYAYHFQVGQLLKSFHRVGFPISLPRPTIHLLKLSRALFVRENLCFVNI